MMKAEYYNEKIKNDPNSQRLVKDQADHWALIVALKNQIDYTDGKKLACLMSLLRGDALESVNACDNIDQNYQPVLNQLMQELGDKNALIDEHISRASTSASTTQRHPPHKCQPLKPEQIQQDVDAAVSEVVAERKRRCRYPQKCK